MNDQDSYKADNFFLILTLYPFLLLESNIFLVTQHWGILEERSSVILLFSSYAGQNIVMYHDIYNIFRPFTNYMSCYIQICLIQVCNYDLFLLSKKKHITYFMTTIWISAKKKVDYNSFVTTKICLYFLLPAFYYFQTSVN